MSDPNPEANAPLEWPPEFPPTDPWDRFFIGVRWIGPDLSFFKDFSKQQAARSANCMEAWGDDARKREVVSVVCNALKKWLGWPNPHFLPLDRFKVIAFGPRFDFIDHLDFAGAVSEIERDLHIKLPMAFWESLTDQKLGQVIDEILRVS